MINDTSKLKKIKITKTKFIFENSCVRKPTFGGHLYIHICVIYYTLNFKILNTPCHWREVKVLNLEESSAPTIE